MLVSFSFYNLSINFIWTLDFTKVSKDSQMFMSNEEEGGEKG